MKTQPPKVGDACAVTYELDFYPGTVKKVTPTGQITAECGVWAGNGLPRIFRFKPARYGGDYREIGESTYSRHSRHIFFGDDIRTTAESLTRQRAVKAGANKIQELRRALENVNRFDLEAMQAATQKLLDAIVAARLIASLPEDGAKG